MIIEVLMLMAIVNLVFISGFPFELDEMVNKRWKFHHIPEKPFLCSVCMSFWTGLLYLIVTQQFSLFGLMMVLVFANCSDIIQNGFACAKTLLNVFFGWIMRVLDRQ